MEKIKFSQLDIPIIRSCNLACVGCMTHSDHKNVKGLVNLEESLDWLKFWGERLQPETVTVFGGEPLLHPNFVQWTETVKSIWTKSDIKVNTNGYYLNNLLDNVDTLFAPGTNMKIIVSVQTGVEPYLSKVKENIAIFKQKIIDYYLSLPGVTRAEWDLWLDEYDINTKQWFRLMVNDGWTDIGLTTCDQYKLPWCGHYVGFGEDMRPTYDYNDVHADGNHKFCQAKEFVTLYKGTLFKCPPIGVLEHSLTTFGIENHPSWVPYLQDYKRLPTTATDEQIQEWFSNQCNPENVCNMCGFTGPGYTGVPADSGARSHHLKNYWNYTL